MQDAEVWNAALLERPASRPFRFVTALRHVTGKDTYCPFHSHRALEIVFHPSGAGVTRTRNSGELTPGIPQVQKGKEERMAARSIRFGEQSVVIYAPDQEHDQYTEEHGEDYCIQLSLPARSAAQLSPGLHLETVDKTWIFEELHRLSGIRTFPTPGEQQVLDLRATALLLALVQSAAAASQVGSVDPARERVRKVQLYIEEHFSTIESLQEVADHAGVSHDYLRHSFKEEMGKPLIQYLNEVRIARARVLLANTPLPQKQIAAQCGFKDEFYFSAVFRKQMGIAPGVFRQEQHSAA